MKTKTKHTQGPWKVLENGKGIGKHCVGTTSDAPIQAVICEIDTKSLQTNDAIRLANARLIAAAPDLLAALKSLRWQYPANSEAHEIAAAAIAKVEGNV